MTSPGMYKSKAQEITFSILMLTAPFSSSLLPEASHEFSPPKNFRLEGPQPYHTGEPQAGEGKHLTVLEAFGAALLGETVELEHEAARAINDHFWELYDAT